MSETPRLIQRTRDTKGRAQYLVRLPIWKRYPRVFILGGGALCGSIVWIYPLYQALFFTEKDIPYQGDWWPSEKAKGKKIVDQYREQKVKQQIWEEEYKKLGDARAANLAMLERFKNLKIENQKSFAEVTPAIKIDENQKNPPVAAAATTPVITPKIENKPTATPPSAN